MSWEKILKEDDLDTKTIDPEFVIWFSWKYDEIFEKYMDEFKRMKQRKKDFEEQI